MKKKIRILRLGMVLTVGTSYIGNIAQVSAMGRCIGVFLLGMSVGHRSWVREYDINITGHRYDMAVGAYGDIVVGSSQEEGGWLHGFDEEGAWLWGHYFEEIRFRKVLSSGRYFFGVGDRDGNNGYGSSSVPIVMKFSVRRDREDPLHISWIRSFFIASVTEVEDMIPGANEGVIMVGSGYEASTDSQDFRSTPRGFLAHYDGQGGLLKGNFLKGAYTWDTVSSVAYEGNSTFSVVGAMKDASNDNLTALTLRRVYGTIGKLWEGEMYAFYVTDLVGGVYEKSSSRSLVGLKHVVTQIGNYYVTGMMQVRNEVTGTNVSHHLFVGEITSSGAPLWFHRLEAVVKTSIGLGIVEAYDGSCLVAGTYEDIERGQGIILLSVAQRTGDLLNAKGLVATDYDIFGGVGLEVSPAGEVYLSGGTHNISKDCLILGSWFNAELRGCNIFLEVGLTPLFPIFTETFGVGGRNASRLYYLDERESFVSEQRDFVAIEDLCADTGHRFLVYYFTVPGIILCVSLIGCLYASCLYGVEHMC